MYREIQRTNGMTETTAYGLDRAQQAINNRENADVSQADPAAFSGDQPEALVAAVSFLALLLIVLTCALQAWL
jgi:hypothetical protein